MSFRYTFSQAVKQSRRCDWKRLNGGRQCSALQHRSFSEASGSNSSSPGESSESSALYPQATKPQYEPESLFERHSTESAWDHVFEGIDDLPPITGRTTIGSPAVRARQTQKRRQAMTASERNAFDDMFNLIFNAVTEQPMKGSSSAKDPLIDSGIGRGGGSSESRLRDVFGSMRRHSKKFKWTAEEDEVLDRKKERMDLCDTDQQLLEFAMREVFEESRQYEQRARDSIAKAAGAPPEEGTPSDSSESKDRAPTTSPSATVEVSSLPPLQPPAYPHLIAYLMYLFREKYFDPHLSLAIFAHAQHLSIASYVFGCTAPAYNELLETRWSCFRDLRGVSEALQEMRVNGVEPDTRTRNVVEAIRREVSDRNYWQEEDGMNTGEVLGMVQRIEELSIRPRKKDASFNNRRWTATSEWKLSGMASKEDTNDDGWKFGDWDVKSDRNGRRNQSSRRLVGTLPRNAYTEHNQSGFR